MKTVNHISQDDLLLFALQFLPEEQMLSAQEHLLECDDCRRQLSFIQGDLVAYGVTAEMHEPPAGARERLLRSIAKEKKVVPISSATPIPAAVDTSAEPEQSSTSDSHKNSTLFAIDEAPVRRRMGVAGWTGWAVAAAAIGAAGLQYQQNRSTNSQLADIQDKYTQSQVDTNRAATVLETLTDVSAKQVVLHLPASKEPTELPEGHASYLSKKGSVVFVANHLAQLQANTTYELWLIPAGPGAKPIPAGTFKPDSTGRASLVTAGLPVGVVAGAFGVTIEPDGGSTAPTLPIILAGE